MSAEMSVLGKSSYVVFLLSKANCKNLKCQMIWSPNAVMKWLKLPRKDLFSNLRQNYNLIDSRLERLALNSRV
jgi:hypothetical protein